MQAASVRPQQKPYICESLGEKRILNYTVTVANVARADEWSKLLFNNIYVLRVSAAISNGDVETDCGVLQRELSLGQAAVYRVIRTLERVNLLERMERSSQTQPIKYRRVSHPFWDAALELLSTAEGA